MGNHGTCDSPQKSRNSELETCYIHALFAVVRKTLKVTRNSAQNTAKCSGFERRRCEQNVTGNTSRKHANYAVHRLSESALSTKSDPCRVPAVFPRKMHRNRGTEGSHQLSRFHVENGGIPGWKPAESMLFSIWIGKCRKLQKSVPQTPQISVVSGGYRGTGKDTGNT